VKPCYILGISAYYHDSAAALTRDGEIIAAAQEERFTRKKHDARFPRSAINYCLKEAGVELRNLHAVVFYDKPLIKFERLLETYFSFAPRGFASFVMAMPVWIKEKLFLKGTLKDELTKLNGDDRKTLPHLWFTEHHQSHAASAFFPSPFNSAAVLCLDGVGEWATTSAWRGNGNSLEPLWEIQFPHSLGLLYSAFTYYTGFKVNSGEYKLMGLAPYGEPKYVDLILKNLIDLKDDGTFRLNLDYFEYMTGLKMTGGKFHELFGGPPRKPESPVTQKEMDIARSIQVVTEEVVLRLARAVQKETGEKYLCLAGGVALNCVANGRLLREGPFEDIWIQPAAGDAGGALGAALSGWYQFLGKSRSANGGTDFMRGSYLGPRFSTSEAAAQLRGKGAVVEELSSEELDKRLADVLADGNVVGWFNGRMEYGPRALGSRSIIGDPRNTKMQSVMNLKIKYRESFRPFAPAVLAEDVSEYFQLDRRSPYMLIVAPVGEKHRFQMTKAQENLFGIEKLNVPRSSIPAITHVDYSARVQTVHKETNPRFYSLLKKFKEKTGTSVLVNTSFNVRGEPIVCTPEDAFRCFMRTEMDYLVVENCLMAKSAQPKGLQGDDSWKKEFELD
jgi:carbamoyltransferase